MSLGGTVLNQNRYLEEYPGKPIPVYNYGSRDEIKGVKVYRPTEEGQRVMRAAIKQAFGESRAQTAREELFKERIKRCVTTEQGNTSFCMANELFEKAGTDIALLGEGLAITAEGCSLLIEQARENFGVNYLDLRVFGSHIPAEGLRYIAQQLPGICTSKVFIGRPITTEEGDWLVDCLYFMNFVKEEGKKRETLWVENVAGDIGGKEIYFKDVRVRHVEFVFNDARSYNRIAARLSKRGFQLEDALRYVNQGLRHRPNLLEQEFLYRNRGDCHEKLNNFEAAISDYKAVLRFNAYSDAAMNDIAVAYRNKKRFSEAITWHHKAINNGHKKAILWRSLAGTLREYWKTTGNVTFLHQAIENMSYALKLEPNKGASSLDSMKRELLSVNV